MTGRTHDLAAVSALLVVVAVNPPAGLTLGTALTAVLANLIGGIAPDIDEPTAPFWRNLPVGPAVGRAFDRLIGGHRFLTHSLIGVGLLGLAAKWLLISLHPSLPAINIDSVWNAFMIGVLSHLVMDTFTKEGVPWLLPLPIRFGFPPLRDLRITTDKFTENYIVFPGLLIADAVVAHTHYPQLLAMLRHLRG